MVVSLKGRKKNFNSSWTLWKIWVISLPVLLSISIFESLCVVVILECKARNRYAVYRRQGIAATTKRLDIVDAILDSQSDEHILSVGCVVCAASNGQHAFDLVGWGPLTTRPCHTSKRSTFEDSTFFSFSIYFFSHIETWCVSVLVGRFRESLNLGIIFIFILILIIWMMVNGTEWGYLKKRRWWEGNCLS